MREYITLKRNEYELLEDERVKALIKTVVKKLPAPQRRRYQQLDHQRNALVQEDALIAAGKGQFGPQTEMLMMGWAFWSQFRTYPEDYIYYYRKGDGVSFDWGLDYTQCVNVTLYKKYDALDLVLPLICTMDYLAGSAMGTGYHRTMQIATGDPMCDLRFKLQE